MQTLNVVGAGNVGKTLAALWQQESVFSISGVANRSQESSEAAVKFIVGGSAVSDISELPDADVFMLSVGDDAIAPACERLTETHDLHGKVVFHCSGSLPSAILEPAGRAGAWVASVHPVKTFADPAASVGTFAGTFCGYEGDTPALDVLLPAFSALGAEMFGIVATNKTLYHTAIVFSMNYLVALVEVGLQCYEEAGVDRELALRVLDPILRSAISNTLELGPAKSLTGPIARGDVGVVSRQLADLAQRSIDLQHLYALLGSFAVELSSRAGRAPEAKLQSIGGLLAEHKA